MDNILLIVEGPKATQVANIKEINQETMQEFLQKNSAWDVYDITRDEYMNKNDNNKTDLIVKFFNYMLEGTIFLFVSLLFEACLLISISIISVSPVCALLIFWYSVSAVCSFFSVFTILSSLSVEFCSVSDALTIADS